MMRWVVSALIVLFFALACGKPDAGSDEEEEVLGCPESASPDRWRLESVTFEDGATAEGFVSYDSRLGMACDWNIRVSGGTSGCGPITYGAFKDEDVSEWLSYNTDSEPSGLKGPVIVFDPGSAWSEEEQGDWGRPLSLRIGFDEELDAPGRVNIFVGRPDPSPIGIISLQSCVFTRDIASGSWVSP